MRTISDIDFSIEKGKIFNGSTMYYLMSSELKSIDPVAVGNVFEPFTTFFSLGLITEHIEKDFIMIDIGANIGYYSVLFASLCKNSKIYSFEPHPKVFEVLKKNAEIYSNITPLNVGISNENKKLELYCDNKNVGGHSYLYDGFGKSFNDGQFDSRTMYKIDSEIKTIDSFGIDFSKVKIVKVDVQGLEEQVLTYIYNLLPKKCVIITEHFDTIGQFATKFNFQIACKSLYGDNNVFFVK